MSTVKKSKRSQEPKMEDGQHDGRCRIKPLLYAQNYGPVFINLL